MHEAMSGAFIEAAEPQQRNQEGAVRPQDSLLCDVKLPLRGMFYPLGFGIEILTNHPEVLDAAHESFGHRQLRHEDAGLVVRVGVTTTSDTQLPPEPTRREFNHLYSLVANADNQALLDLRTSGNFVWLSEAALQSQLYFRYNFLEKVVYLLLGATVVTDIHAACVSKEGKGILLCGHSGAGKSTLSYACARAGWTYTSDDTCYLINASKTPQVIGHAHRMRFRPHAKALFPELENRAITPRMEGKPSIEILVRELPSIDTATEVEVGSVVYLNRYTGAKANLIRLPHGSAAKRMSQELYSAGEIRARHEKVLERLNAVPVFELHYCVLDEGIEQLELLVRAL